MLHNATLSSEYMLQQSECNPREKFSIIVHGWHENCEVGWVTLLIKSKKQKCRSSPISLFLTIFFTTELKQYRGGCVICMDFEQHSSESFIRLVRNFEPIVQILTLNLVHLEQMGFDMNNGYMFGFSFGGQLVTEAGRRIGFERLSEIDSNYICFFIV